MSEDHRDRAFKGYGYHTRIDTGGTGANFHRSLDGCQHGEIKVFKVDKDGVETLDRIEPVKIKYVAIGRADDFEMETFQCVDCGNDNTRAVKVTWHIRCTPCAKEHKRLLAGKSRARQRAKVNAT